MSLSFTSCDFLILNFSDIVQDCPQRKDWTGATFQCSGNFMETGRFGIGFGSHQEWYTSSKGSRRIRNTKVVLSTRVCGKLKNQITNIPPPPSSNPTEYYLPFSGTLYGRCKKVGIELSKNAAVHWSEDAMKKALSSYQTGGMSINQAAIHYNLPYSSLYGRINR